MEQDPFFLDPIATGGPKAARRPVDPFNIAQIQDTDPDSDARSGRTILAVPTATSTNGYPKAWATLSRASGKSIPRMLHVLTQVATDEVLAAQNGYAGIGLMAGSMGVPSSQLEPFAGFNYHGDSAALRIDFGYGSGRRTIYADLAPGSYALPPSDNIIVSAARWCYDHLAQVNDYEVQVLTSIADGWTAEKNPLTISGVANIVAGVTGGIAGWRVPPGAYAWDLDILSTTADAGEAPQSFVPGDANAPVLYTSGLQSVLVDASTPQKWPPSSPYPLRPQVSAEPVGGLTTEQNTLLVNAPAQTAAFINARLTWFVR